MSRKWSFALACLLVAASAPHAAIADGTATASGIGDAGSLRLALGRDDFETYCASCHGESGRGDGPVGEFIALRVADLTQLTRKNGGRFPAELVERVIDGREEVKVHGPRDMPVWGDWFDVEADQPGLRAQEREIVVRERIATLTAYIKSLQQD